jgi:hypothetical protein
VNDGDSLFMGLLYAAIVCVLVILIDGWFLRPQRDPGATGVDEPIVARLAGYALVGLALAMLWRLFRYEAVDFSFMLVLVGAISGGIWGLDQAFFARRRKRRAEQVGTPPDRVREPIAVEYARSFFPVIVLVLVIRSFRAVPHSLGLHDADLVRRRFHFREQVLVWLAAAGHQSIDHPDRNTATRRRDRLQAAAESEDQLHQAPGRTARGRHPGR